MELGDVRAADRSQINGNNSKKERIDSIAEKMSMTQSVLSALYKNNKTCKHIQRTVFVPHVRKWADSVSACQPFEYSGRFVSL
jgi:hypothetical protein